MTTFTVENSPKKRTSKKGSVDKTGYSQLSLAAPRGPTTRSLHLQHIPLDLLPLTQTSARNNTLSSILQQDIGTPSSRTGHYRIPSCTEVMHAHISRCPKCLLFIVSCLMLEVVTKIFSTVLRSSDPLIVNKTTDGLFHLTTSDVDSWCLTGGDGLCECHDPLLSQPRYEQDGWMLAHKLNLELVANASAWSSNFDNEVDIGEVVSPDVVFLGDSITEEWNGRRYGTEIEEGPNITHVFQSLFHNSPDNVEDKNDAQIFKVEGLALGIEGDQSFNLLWRIQNGEVSDNLNPKVWWILIGTNDFGDSQCSEDIVFLGIIRVVEEIRIRKPNAIIVINGILPRTFHSDGSLVSTKSINTLRHGSNSGNEYPNVDNNADKTSPELWPSIVAVNSRLETFCQTHDKIEYFDASHIFVAQMSTSKFKREDSFVLNELMKDYLHPSALGHQLWGEEILKRLHQILTSESKTTSYN